MGAVFKALQPNLDRDVAIKVLPLGLEEDGDDLQFVERFKLEAKAMARLNHPGIVSVHDSGEAMAPAGRLLYFVMEFVEGVDIREYLKENGGKLSPMAAHTIISHVLDALGFAHEKGIVHRDIKPANIMLNQHGRVKVADFGVAKALGAGDGIQTQTHMMVGTPDYAAPEARDLGSVVDGRADLYAVGAMFYQLLTGKFPRGAFKPVSEGADDIDPRYDNIITKALQPDPEDRYQTAEEFQDELEEILREPLLAPSEMIRSGQSRSAVEHEEADFAVSTRGFGDWMSRLALVALFAGLAWFMFAETQTGWLSFSVGYWLAGVAVIALIGRPTNLVAALLGLSLIPLGWLETQNWQGMNPIESLGIQVMILLFPLGLFFRNLSRSPTAGSVFLKLALGFGIGVFAVMLLGWNAKFSLPLWGEVKLGPSQLRPIQKMVGAQFPSLEPAQIVILLRSIGIAALMGCLGIWFRPLVRFSALLLAGLTIAGIALYAANSDWSAMAAWGPSVVLYLSMPLLAISVGFLMRGQPARRSAVELLQDRKPERPIRGM